MERICSFNDYVILKEGSRAPSSKTGLYPLGYGGIGNYPLADYLTHAADAIFYVSIDDRLYHNGDSAPFDISHLPGHKQYGDDVNNGDSKPFCLDNLPGHKTYCNPNNGEKQPFSIEKIPGETKPFKDFVKLVQFTKMISPHGKNMPE